MRLTSEGATSMRKIGRILIGTALAATMVASGTAQARPWGYGGGYYGGYHRHYYHHGCGGCGFLLGAGIVGAIALAANSGPREREIYVERSAPPPYPYDYPPEPPVVYDAPPPPPPPPPVNYNRGASNDRDAAVDVCKVAAEREGEKYSSRVRIDNIDDVRSQREGGYRVTGVVTIDKGGYNDNRAGNIEHSRFDCTAAGGRVVAFRFGSSAEMAQRY